VGQWLRRDCDEKFLVSGSWLNALAKCAWRTINQPFVPFVFFVDNHLVREGHEE
jgi:hypothetical protein